MNPLIQLKKATAVLFVVLACFGLSPISLAVNPPPDGGYPNQNTAEGDNALLNLTTGINNTALGFHSLLSDTTGSRNTATGAFSLLNNTEGTHNTATGFQSLYSSTTAEGNTAVGAGALLFNITGSFNVAVGTFALRGNSTGGAGIFNNAVGAFALDDIVVGSFNNAHGRGALQASDGDGNNAFGDATLFNNVSGSFNTAIGDFALVNSLGSFNTALGAEAGTDPGIGSNNIYIGDSGFAGDTNVISIGGIAASGTPYENTFIGGIYDTVVTDRIVYVAADGHLGTLASSRRYKEQIKPMDKASEALFALQPVTFRYKQQIDPSHKVSFGLIAEDVAKVSPDLISRDKEGNPQTVRYEAVNAMLLNEFIKEHQKVQKLEAALAAVNERLKAQDAKIDKVSAKVELSKSAPKTALNNQ